MNQSRLSLLEEWLCNYFKLDSITLKALTGDAGFRKYYRFSISGQPYIAVDAIPDKSNNLAFVEIQQVLHQQNINVPNIITYDLAQGFLCLSDFGNALFSDLLTLDNMEASYKEAIKLLPLIAGSAIPTNYKLPRYDADFVHLECNIFSEWLLGTHLNINLSEQERSQLHTCFTVLVGNALEQPQVVMHRDFHSRNLMILNSSEVTQDLGAIQLGVIDFQDAVIGPITYDIVSLLRDCYVKWPNDKVTGLFQYFCQLMDIENKYPNISQAQWQRWFDLMGMQRHVKASGIFARLYHRDDKTGYLQDIPLTLSYIVDISAKYSELSFLHDLVLHKVIPALAEKELKKVDTEDHSL
ncbi:aminoglycoside phosphotransferase family protein [Pseudocolwellia sp. HL-MZ19]|uniref:aminoglycoside phosphotransferase family protein n=1 Tax=Pseudocolwellia sp. HL-MZ19 TaxID=3400846 RepID=UPI003CEFEA04